MLTIQYKIPYLATVATKLQQADVQTIYQLHPTRTHSDLTSAMMYSFTRVYKLGFSSRSKLHLLKGDRTRQSVKQVCSTHKYRYGWLLVYNLYFDLFNNNIAYKYR